MKETTVTRSNRCLMLAICAAALAGCHADKPPIGGINDKPGPFPNITLNQQSLQDALRFQTPIVSRTANNNMHVALPLRADSDDTLHIEYRAVWYDAAGREIPPAMSWAPMRLDPRQAAQISVVSTSDAAVDYNIQLRWGKR
jgi:uncharacterized protein YcfL